nr:unnamed protein product [Callosobruchus analis]
MEELRNTIKSLTEENKNIKKEHEKLKGKSERVRKANPDTNKSIVVVKFCSEDLRIRVLEERKGIFLDSQNCNIDDLKTRLFINEALSRPTRELFKKARELRQKGYKYVWCKHQQVYVRKMEGEQAVRISSLADVQQLL